MFKIVFALLALLSVAHAQQIEQIQTVILHRVPCIVGTPAAVDGFATGNQEVFLENYVDTILPPVTYIVRSTIWVEGIDPIAPNTYGNLAYAVDPGRSYALSSAYPATQNITIQYLKTLGALQLFPRGSQFVEFKYDPPIAYRTGDALVIAPECIGGQTLLGYLHVMIQGTQDFISQPQPVSLLSVSLDHPAAGQPGASVRSKTAPLSAPMTKIRARVHSAVNPDTPSNEVLSRAEVCLQDGETSSCLTPPTELKVNSRSGATLIPTQWVWTDWTTFSGEAGQVPLITCHFYSPGNTNTWSLKTSGGLGAWATLSDSRGQKDLLGTVTAQSTWTQCVDRVQIQ